MDNRQYPKYIPYPSPAKYGIKQEVWDDEALELWDSEDLEIFNLLDRNGQNVAYD